MKKRFSTVVLTSFIAGATFAQINTGMMYDPHFTTYASRYLPSRLGTDDGIVELNALPFFNIYAYASSNSVNLNIAEIKDIAANGITTDKINDLVAHMKPGTGNRLFFGADMELMSLSVKIKNKDKKELFTFKLNSRERIMGSLQYSKNTFSLATQGNKQFAGETVDLDMQLNASYLHEYGFGASVPISLNVGAKKLIIRPAATFKVLVGIADASMPKGKASVYTQPDGRYLDFNYNYRLNLTSPVGFDGGDIDPMGVVKSVFGGSGWGLGGDIGVNVNWDDFVIVDAGVTDIGRVNFTKNTKNYANSGSYRYDGVEAQLFHDGEGGNPSVNIDFLQEVFQPEESEKKYQSRLGAKLFLQGEVRLQKKERTSKKGKVNKYFRHRVFVTYVQGLENSYNSTTAPYFSAGYVYSFRNIINVGPTFGFNGYNKYNFGAFFSVKGGPFVFGFGSNNLSGLFPKIGSGVDGYFNMGFSF